MTTFLIIVLFVLLLFVSACLFVSIAKNLKQMEKLEELGNQVDQSIDVLDQTLSSLINVSQTPLLSDEPTVKMLIETVRSSIDSVKLVQAKLVYFDIEEEDE